MFMIYASVNYIPVNIDTCCRFLIAQLLEEGA